MGLVNITISTKRRAFCISYWKTRLSSNTMACTRPARSISPSQTQQQIQQFVRALPAAELLELCCWRVACQCICEDDDCRCQTLSCFKVGRFSTQYSPVGEYCPRSPADQSQVKAARAEIKRRSLCCCCCGRKLVPIGDARTNGTWRHNDWSSRRYHKKCWLAALRGDFGEGAHETDVE